MLKPAHLAEIRRTGGHGDRIMASNHDPKKPWYYLKKTGERVFFNPDFRPARGRIDVLYDMDVDPDAVMFHPQVKSTFSADNRQWPMDRWQELVRKSPYPIVQCGPVGSDYLGGVERIETPTFAHAVAVLAKVRGLVSSEGGMQHAAAALRKPAVIIWGAWSPPEIMGYDDHYNISSPDPNAVGWRYSHPACKAAMERISVNEVLQAMRETWN